MLLKLQLASSIVHFFLKFQKKLKYERLLSIVAILLWIALYKYFAEHYELQEHYITFIEGKGVNKIGMNDFTVMLVGLVVGFWYYSICLREIRVLAKKRKKG